MGNNDNRMDSMTRSRKTRKTTENIEMRLKIGPASHGGNKHTVMCGA